MKLAMMMDAYVSYVPFYVTGNYTVVCVLAVRKHLRLYAPLVIRRAGHAVRSSAAPHSKYHFEVLTFSLCEAPRWGGWEEKSRSGKQVVRPLKLLSQNGATDILLGMWVEDGAGTRHPPSPHSAARGTRRPPKFALLLLPPHRF